MSQLSQSKKSGIGNTRIPSSNHWCFTWNNYDEKGISELLSQLAHTKFVFQEENAGTPHLQGYVDFKKRTRPMEKIKIPSIHWEKCRSVKHSISYCSDEEKRKGRIWNNDIELSEDQYENILKKGEKVIVGDNKLAEWVIENHKTFGIPINEKISYWSLCVINKWHKEVDYIILYAKDETWKKLKMEEIEARIIIVTNY